MSILRALTSENIDEIHEGIPELTGQVTLHRPIPEFQGNYSDVYRGIYRTQEVC
jgi:hypothetical protein